MYLKYALLVCALLMINCVRSASAGGDGFGFPEASEEDKSKQNVMVILIQDERKRDRETENVQFFRKDLASCIKLYSISAF